MRGLVRWLALGVVVAGVAVSAAGAEEWGAPVDLSADDATTPQVVVEEGIGIATAVWYRIEEGCEFGHLVVMAARFQDGEWGDPAEIGDAGCWITAEISPPPVQVAVDGDSRVTAAWLGVDAETAVLRVFASRFSGSSWSSPEALSRPDASAWGPQLAANPNGRVAVVWTDPGELGVSAVRASLFVDGAWTDPVELSDPTAPGAEDPQVAVGWDGTVAVAWEGLVDVVDDEDIKSVQVSQFRHEEWSLTPVPVSILGEGLDADDPQLAVDPSGEIHVVWEYATDIPGVGVVQVSRSVEGGSAWLVPETLSAVDEHADDPQVAVDADGRVTVVWSGEFEENVQVVRASRSGEGWMAPVTLSDPGHPAEVVDLVPALAVGADGAVTVVWAGGESFPAPTQVSRFAGGVWSDAVRISADGEWGTLAQVAAGGGGNVVVVWLRNDEFMSGVVRAVVLGASSDAEVPPPPRAGYCLNGVFMDLVFRQPESSPLYETAVPALFVQGRGITCDPPPAGFTRQGFATSAMHVHEGLYPYWAPPVG